MADINSVNLNMLFVRYSDAYERERHLPLGLLYLTSVLERAGYDVDFRDYQMCDAEDPFDLEAFIEFVKDPAPTPREFDLSGGCMGDTGLSATPSVLCFTRCWSRAVQSWYKKKAKEQGYLVPRQAYNDGSDETLPL